MTVENQDRDLAPPLELQATSKEEVHRRSKTVYTREFLLSCAELDDCRQFVKGFDISVFRPSKSANTREFLLSCAELDVCKQLPEGFDSSFLLELEDNFKGLLEPWKGSGILVLPNSDNIKCRAQFSGLDSSGSSWESVGKSDYLSFRWSRESNSQRNSHSDFRRHDDLTPCSVKVSGCKAEDMEKRSQETGKNDYFQLSKSENPYRPPHTYQGSRTKYERKSHSKETVIEKDSGIQKDTWSEGPIIGEVEQHDIKDATSSAENISNCPVFKPTQESNVTSDGQIIQFDSKKANASTVTEVSEQQYRMTSREYIASPLKVSSDCSSTAIEKASPRRIAVKFECEKSHELISGMEFNDLLNNGPFNSGRKGSFNGISEYEVSELYKLPFILAYDVARSVLQEHNPIRTNHQGITAYAAEVMDSYDMEDNECPFDDMWSEIMEILQFEQEMELSSASESNQTPGFKVQISFPGEYSLISVDNLASSEHSTFVLVNSSDGGAHYDAKIHLPDKDNSITVEDLIAPLDRLISTDNLTEAEHLTFAHLTSCIRTADYTEIHLPDEDDLIATNDLIAPNHLKQLETDDTCMSDSKGEVARPGARVTINPAQGSATQGLEVPPSLDVIALEAHPELHFSHSTLHNPCNGINHETTFCYPFNSLEVQTSLRTTFMDPVPVHCYPALHWYSSPNMVHQFPGKTVSTKLREFSDPYVQYSALQKPGNFLQQYHLAAKHMAYSNSEVEKKLLYPPWH